MKTLIVLAHPEPRSLNVALKDKAVETLLELGHQVQVSDLYAMNWKAELGIGDFTDDRADPADLGLSREQEHAFANNAQTDDVKAEQSRVVWDDWVIFQFPLWWVSMPAILKGWVDRVLSPGVAYSSGCK